MAKKRKVSKTQSVRDYLKDHPGAMNVEIAAALKKQGIKITPAHVGTIKTIDKKAHAVKNAAKKPAVVEAATPAEKPAKNGRTTTLNKPQANKTQAVRDYLKDHPNAMSGEIAAALNKQGIEITPGYVAGIKTMINKTSTAKKPAAAAPAVAPAVVEKPLKNGDAITLTQVKLVAATIKTLGGIQRVMEVLAVIKELGGVKKFMDLAEAMTATGTDDIPF